MKKNFLIYLVIILLIIVGVLIFLIQKQQPNEENVNARRIKQENLTLAEGVVTFTVPIDWNAAINGDSVFISKFEEIGNHGLTYFSVSSPSSPITYADINWTQLDVYVSSVDLFTDTFVQRMTHPTSGVKVTEIPNANFAIYAEKELLPAGQLPQKGEAGGTTYYLKPKISNPTWNIIVRKQALGDAAFEADADAIMKSFSFRPQP